MKLKFDWINPEDLINTNIANKIEEYMLKCLLLDPNVEVPSFDEKTKTVKCNNNFSFLIPGNLRKRPSKKTNSNTSWRSYVRKPVQNRSLSPRLSLFSEILQESLSRS
jgi:hypothetical protein